MHTGYRWYLVAFDLDRDDWRTFRIDGSAAACAWPRRGRLRTVPGGDPAAFVKQRHPRRSSVDGRRPGARKGPRAGERGGDRPGAFPAVTRPSSPTARTRCIVVTRGAWSRHFLVWMALLDRPMEVLEPPEFRTAGARLADTLRAATIDS